MATYARIAECILSTRPQPSKAEDQGLPTTTYVADIAHGHRLELRPSAAGHEIILIERGQNGAATVEHVVATISKGNDQYAYIIARPGSDRRYGCRTRDDVLAAMRTLVVNRQAEIGYV